MRDGNLLILTGSDIRSLLDKREGELIDTVAAAYLTHSRGDSCLPHSTFVHISGNTRDRIITLPCYLGGSFEVAGVKWIASFPANVLEDMDRASGVVVLSSATTGRPNAIMEGSSISAIRTAASATLAAQTLHVGEPSCLGMIGCGLINFETLRFLLKVFPQVQRLVLFDSEPNCASYFRDRALELNRELQVDALPALSSVLREAPLVSFATTALSPYVPDLSLCPPGATVLHLSLRDIHPEALIDCDNVVDDVDHVCRADTSLHLAEQLYGHRKFIRCNLADILSGEETRRSGDRVVTVFSPFGLGVLDVAVAALARNLAASKRLGTIIPGFLPESWRSRRR